jgi:biotin carboxyl carrier protein
MASAMSGDLLVTRIADGVYRVEHEGRLETVYVTGPAGDRWAFWNGQVFRGTFSASTRAPAIRRAGADAAQSLAAPMPATVLRVLVTPGAAVRKGDTVVILEAMKMELPVRAPSDGIVSAVCCREGELVQSEAILIELR